MPRARSKPAGRFPMTLLRLRPNDPDDIGGGGGGKVTRRRDRLATAPSSRRFVCGRRRQRSFHHHHHHRFHRRHRCARAPLKPRLQVSSKVQPASWRPAQAETSCAHNTMGVAANHGNQHTIAARNGACWLFRRQQIGAPRSGIEANTAGRTKQVLKD